MGNQTMNSNRVSFSVATTLQTSCMQKRRNSQGGHKPKFVILPLQMLWGTAAVGSPGACSGAEHRPAQPD